MTGYLLIFRIVLPWLVMGLGCWIGYLLIRQNGRILLRLEALEERLAQLRPTSPPSPAAAPRPGLAIGSIAPAFELPDLAGNRKALVDFRGRRLLLLFFNPRCGYCTRMAADLASLPTDRSEGRPLPLVLTTGEAAENLKLVAQHRIPAPVLLQERMEIASLYQTGSTPSGYLIDEEGRVASALAVGAKALLELATNPAAPVASANGTAHKEHKGNRPLSESRINRSGLAAGTPAPLFTLPRLDGGELSLEEYHGRRVLLVFSDPKCGPCNTLAPRLEQLHRRTGDVQVVMLSRGDVEANRAKAEEHGLTFPVALQRQWEISRRYAIFSTPVGYLIDEAGVIAAPMAVGAEMILALAAHTASAATPTVAGRPCRCGKPVNECGCGRENGRATAVQQRRR